MERPALALVLSVLHHRLHWRARTLTTDAGDLGTRTWSYAAYRVGAVALDRSQHVADLLASTSAHLICAGPALHPLATLAVDAASVKTAGLAASPARHRLTAPVKQLLGLGSNAAHRLQHRLQAPQTSRQEDSWRGSSWWLAKPTAAAVSETANQRLERLALKSLPLSPPSSASLSFGTCAYAGSASTTER